MLKFLVCTKPHADFRYWIVYRTFDHRALADAEVTRIQAEEGREAIIVVAGRWVFDEQIVLDMADDLRRTPPPDIHGGG